MTSSSPPPPPGTPPRVWALLAITAIAALLRMPLLGRPVWFDEACMSDQRIGTTAQWLATLYVDIHPPLFVSFMHFWNGWFGDEALTMRLPALLSGLLCIPLTWWTGHRLVGDRAALLACLLLALSPVHVWYCAEARLYAPMIACTLLAFGCVDRLTDGASRWPRLLFALHAINVAVMLSLHYYLAVFVAALAALAPLLTRGTSRRAAGLLWLHGVGLALLASFLLLKLQLGQLETSQHYLKSLDGRALFNFVFAWCWTGETLQATSSSVLRHVGEAAMWFGVGLLLLGAVHLLVRSRRHPRGLLTLVGLLALPAFLLVCALVGLDSTFVNRSSIAALPFALLLAGAGVERLPAALRKAAAGAALAFAGAALLALYFTYETEWTVYKPHPDWQSAAAYLGDEIDAGAGGSPVFTSMPNPRTLSYYDPRIQDDENLKVRLRPADIADKVERLAGGALGARAAALFEDFATHKRSLRSQADLLIRRCRPRAADLALPPDYTGPCYL
ncbi:MAG: glycosyltransferase family 39 protein, partial [Planctomycetota bacterium]|nr:glycosyltransferase family 39 protein [Planctomycetota bacterium]